MDPDPKPNVPLPTALEEMARPSRSKFVQAIRVLLILLGFSLLAVAYLGRSTPEKPAGEQQYPLEGANGITIDREGRIYCGLPRYQRVQVYDRNGRFLRSFPVEAAKGGFRLGITEDGLLEVATARNGMLYTFDATGQLRSSSEAPSAFARLGEKGQWEARDLFGGKIAFARGSIVRETPEGRSEVVVKRVDSSWRDLTIRSPLRVAVQGAALILAGVLFNDRWLGAIRRIARLRWTPFRTRS